MVRKWRNQQDVLFSGELKMTAKRASMGRYRPKDPELDQLLADWFSDQRQMPSYVFAWSKSASSYYLSWLFPCTHASLVHCIYWLMLFLFCIQVFQLTAWCSMLKQRNSSGVQSITSMVQQLETPPFHFHVNQDHPSPAPTSWHGG